MRPPRLLDSLLLLFLSISLYATAPDSVRAQDEEPSVLAQYTDSMRWRNIGPTRGGRSVTATGVVGHPQTYYFGATGGGVWKTTDAGITWTNVTDGFLKTGSVGAVAVAESDPNVVYVGMGEHAIRGVTTSHGDGVYRSTDAGRTWTHLGLEGTRAISRIRIHPQDPDLVYVAAQGAPYGPTEDRGIYRSRDGGATWEKILYVSERAGASELAMDMTNPRILYASFWDHLRRPWVVESGGDGSGIWKSVDGGDTWEQINDGLPDLVGKIAVDVSRANPDRLYANVEAMPGEGGVFRSDDAGASWQLMTSARIVQTRSWYYMEIFADPQDEETVYVMNAPFLKSIDGGRTFTTVAVPHGDQHDLWINPADNRNMINANDGGANVTFNGGDSWSTQRNQPTAQFYRVITDNQFPYHVYGGQQDNSAVGIRSAALGGIGWQHFYSTAGCESAYLAFDPDEPEDVFGGCYQGLIARWNRETEMSKPIMAYPFLGLGTYPSEQRFRFNWNAPIVASPHDPSIIYHAGNVVFRTRDKGQTWDVISPDLTRDEEEKQAAGGTPITNEGAGGENYNTIMYLTESANEAGTIWVGTDDGLVHVTRDDGANWTDVTPPDIGESIINSIETSPHDPAKVFLVVTRYKFNDFTPLVYRTRDYGANWTLVADGIEEDHWVRAVREDPVRPGLLYAGTELGVFVSMNDGDSWEKWQLNLPIVPITDLQVRNNDLVAATQGRAFWILDDLSPLQQLSDEASNASMHLHTPRDAVMAPFFGGGSGVGANPPGGAQIFYLFDEAPEGLVTLDVLDGTGAVIRRYATDPEEAGDENFSELAAPTSGLNRASWDFRHEGVQGIEGYQNFGSLAGRVAAPGRYQVRLSHGDISQTVDLNTLADPRLAATASQYRAQEQFVADAQTTLADLYESVRELSNVSDQVGSVVENTEDHPMADTIRTAGESLQERITDWEGSLIQRQQQTFQDVINFKNQLDAQIAALIGSVDGLEPPLTAGARERWTDLSGQWQGHRESMLQLLEAVGDFNQWLTELGIDPIVIPGAGRTVS